MNPIPPHLDERRAEEFSAELTERARAWIPTWGLADSERDFGRALLQIAARFSSEVAERLDGAGDKMRRGFLDWLGVRGKAAQPARVPVVFKLASAAREAVLASAPARLQADVGGTPVVFETEEELRVIPGQLEILVGVDADTDELFLSPPGLNDLQPLEPLPTQWRLKSFTAAGATKLQLDPELGLVKEMILAAGGQQYRIDKVDKDLVTIEPPLDTDLPDSTLVSKVTTFAPFSGEARNWQEHALYLGDEELLNIESEASIEVVGARALREGYTWEYSGKRDLKDPEAVWLPLDFDDARQPSVNDAVVLLKQQGAIEMKPVGEKTLRWLRAYKKTVAGTDTFTGEEFSLRINSSGCDGLLPCPPQTATTSPPAEAMSNTTPLVLDNVFYPLGKEPRQFDAFYLSSQEAFSKIGARVQLCFEMADRTFSALAAVPSTTPQDFILAGVAKDRALHLLKFDSTTGTLSKFEKREPLQPPQPGYLGTAEPGNVVALDPNPPWRLPVWSVPEFSFLVGTSAGDAIWIWREHLTVQLSSGWSAFGTLPPPTSPGDALIAGLVFLKGSPSALYALRDSHLFTSEWGTTAAWNEVTLSGETPNQLASIVAVLVQITQDHLETSRLDGMIGIDANKQLYRVRDDGTCTRDPDLYNLDEKIRPAAIQIGGDLIVAAVAVPNATVLVAKKGNSNPKTRSLEKGKEVVGALEVIVSNGDVYVLATVRDAAGIRLVSWAPFVSEPRNILFESEVFSGGGVEAGPVALGKAVVVPGRSGDLFISKFDPSPDRRLLKQGSIETGLVVPDLLVLQSGDVVVCYGADSNQTPEGKPISTEKYEREGQVMHPLASRFSSGKGSPYTYVKTSSLDGAFNDPELTLDPSDKVTVANDWLWVGNSFYKVLSIEPSTATATLDTSNAVTAPGTALPTAKYVRPIETGGRVAPFMRLATTPGASGASGGSGDWDARLLTRISLIFPNNPPTVQPAKAFKLDSENKPTIVVLGSEFNSWPTTQVEFFVDGAFDEWTRDVGDTSANPELSWEYSNGKGWWKLPGIVDETQHLKATGLLKFEIPSDIASSDWAGKTSFWIRARLVGGDYGKEKVTAISEEKNGKTIQTIERSTEGIRAPAVVKLHISYGLCAGTRPKVVLTQDSGTLHDQSEANNTPGAVVEAFVPLSIMLGRLADGAGAADPAQADCPPECADPKQLTNAAARPVAAAQAPAAALTPATGRALLVGLSAAPSEAPVNVLFLAEEHDHSAFAPMTLHALIADRFDPLITEDTTRALGESGLLSMTFADPPTRSDLFGQKGLTWLRLIPKPSASREWKPVLRGAYLNAVWASARETLTRELLGSSDGAPDMTVRLARPPLLHHTLELRVKEPLGEAEREQLKRENPSKIRNLQELPGDWVLWEQVTDPNDEAPDARVYALDEASGEIRFGDGVHGLIPPIGRDSIVAFSYQRTEPPAPESTTVPGNLVSPRTPLNLVSPVETVESVIAADQSAGGAPAEDDSTVLRFGYARLRHRDRVVTLQDLQDLALESSPDIAQAHAVARQGYVRLVVVMTGENPLPNEAQKRELRRYLLARTLTALAAPSALQIAGPALRCLRLDLTLQVTSLDRAGAVGKAVKDKLEAMFDTVKGGIAKNGWQLGANPGEDDIAFALYDISALSSIEQIKLLEIMPDGTELAWNNRVRPNELLVLDRDPVRIHFETLEVPQ